MHYFCRLEKDGDGYSVNFPDLPNVLTWASSESEALDMAYEALNAVLEAEISLELASNNPSNQRESGLYPVEVAPQIAVTLQLRKLRGIHPQKELAEKMGVSYQAYQRLENPRKGNPTVKTLERLAKVHGKKLEITFR